MKSASLLLVVSPSARGSTAGSSLKERRGDRMATQEWQVSRDDEEEEEGRNLTRNRRFSFCRQTYRLVCIYYNIRLLKNRYELLTHIDSINEEDAVAPGYAPEPAPSSP